MYVCYVWNVNGASSVICVSAVQTVLLPIVVRNLCRGTSVSCGAKSPRRRCSHINFMIKTMTTPATVPLTLVKHVTHSGPEVFIRLASRWNSLMMMMMMTVLPSCTSWYRSKGVTLWGWGANHRFGDVQATCHWLDLAVYTPTGSRPIRGRCATCLHSHKGVWYPLPLPYHPQWMSCVIRHMSRWTVTYRW